MRIQNALLLVEKVSVLERIDCIIIVIIIIVIVIVIIIIIIVIIIKLLFLLLFYSHFLVCLLRLVKVIPWFCNAHLLLRITRWPP